MFSIAKIQPLSPPEEALFHLCNGIDQFLPNLVMYLIVNICSIRLRCRRMRLMWLI